MTILGLAYFEAYPFAKEARHNPPVTLRARGEEDRRAIEARGSGTRSAQALGKPQLGSAIGVWHFGVDSSESENLAQND